MSYDKNIKLTIVFDDCIESKPIYATISYEYEPGSRGRRDHLGVPIEPDDPPSADIISIKINNMDISKFLDNNTIHEIADHVAWLHEE